MIKHKLLRKVSLPIRVKVERDWGTLHGDEFHDLSSSDFGWSNQIA